MCNAMVPQHVAPAQAAVFAALGQHPAGTDIAAWDTMLRDCFMRAIGAACTNKRWELSGDAGKYSDSFIFCLFALFHILTHLTRHCFLLTMQPLLKQTQCCAVCALHAPASAALTPRTQHSCAITDAATLPSHSRCKAASWPKPSTAGKSTVLPLFSFIANFSPAHSLSIPRQRSDEKQQKQQQQQQHRQALRAPRVCSRDTGVHGIGAHRARAGLGSGNRRQRVRPGVRLCKLHQHGEGHSRGQRNAASACEHL